MGVRLELFDPTLYNVYKELGVKAVEGLGKAQQDAVNDAFQAGENYFVSVWNSFFETLMTLLPPLFEKMGELGSVKDLAEQEARVIHRPAVPDPYLLRDLVFKRPDLNNLVWDAFKRQGFSDERAAGIIESGRMPPAEAAIRENFIRHHIDQEESVNWLTQNSMHREDAEFLIRSWWSKQDVITVKQLFLRNEIDYNTALKRITDLGFTEEHSEEIIKLFFYIPPAQDIIRMAVRETFTPAIAERFGQYEDYPVEFEKYALMQGLDPFWAKNYWAAHWELPGIMQGFEMLHRRVINQDDLALLLRALDVMPFWRDKLIKISYTTYTRVDVRRMFQLGVLDRNQVFESYLDLGYDPEKAENMTRFTELYAIEQERELTKAEALSAYEKGLVSRDDCLSYLGTMEYSENQANLLMEMTDHKKEKAYRETVIKGVKTRYIEGVYTENEVITELTRIAMPSTEMEIYLRSWEADKLAKVRTLSKKELLDAMKANIMTEQAVREELRKQNYTDFAVNIIIQLSQVEKGS